MSEENVQRVRGAVDAFNRRDFDAAIALVREDVTWDRVLSRTEAQAPVVRGKQELRAVWESQVEAVDIRMEPDEFIPLGDSKVIVPGRMVGKGRSSEMELAAVVVWTFNFCGDGLVRSVEASDSREVALEAAGLRE